jgi:hypothetical protein
MKTESFFAPLVRGVLLEKTHCPWMVVFSADGKGGESADLAITAEAGDEKVAGKNIVLAFTESKYNKENKIPLRIKISSNGTIISTILLPVIQVLKRSARENRRKLGISRILSLQAGEIKKTRITPLPAQQW